DLTELPLDLLRQLKQLQDVLGLLHDDYVNAYWARGIALQHPDEEDLQNIRTIEKNDIKLSLIAVTSSTNGLYLPVKSPLKIIKTENEELLEQQVKAAREISDFVVVSMHWGSEYATKNSENQRIIAQKLADWGADLIIGTHPHVLQPVEELVSADGRKVLVAYSIGNFVSAQNEGPRIIGAMLSLDLEKNLSTGETYYKNPCLIPTITHYGAGFSDLKIYPLSDYEPDLAKSHGVRKYTDGFDINYIIKNLTMIVDDAYLQIPDNIQALLAKQYEVFLLR
ncbi:MAG: CapA family protein, partial [Spirochaetaceae bacterium]|nr:CapA family protein [Spirochaetaceae bacterium]